MKKICEHCGAESAPGMHKRWHGDNCKQKPSTNQSQNDDYQCHVDEESDIPTIKNPKSLLSNGENKMSTFVEVVSADKDCQMIINLDHVSEIIPLAVGGCIVTLNYGGAKTELKVKDDYGQFRQFAMQTVSSEDIERHIKKLVADTARL